MEVNIIKIGGGIMDNRKEMNNFLEQFNSMSGYKILVHGGGRGANEVLEKMGIQPKMLDGRRVTDASTLEVVVQLYAGLYNKNIVSRLNALGTLAIGLSGADGGVLLSKKRKSTPVDYGFVGDPLEDGLNISLVETLINEGYTPTCCAITMDKTGQLLNTNADTIASNIARQLSFAGHLVSLTFCFDKAGVLKDVEDEASLISNINLKVYKSLLDEELIHQGMRPKLENAFEVLRSGIKELRLCHPKNLNSKTGTIIRL